MNLVFSDGGKSFSLVCEAGSFFTEPVALAVGKPSEWEYLGIGIQAVDGDPSEGMEYRDFHTFKDNNGNYFWARIVDNDYPFIVGEKYTLKGAML